MAFKDWSVNILDWRRGVEEGGGHGPFFLFNVIRDSEGEVDLRRIGDDATEQRILRVDKNDKSMRIKRIKVKVRNLFLFIFFFNPLQTGD